MSHDLIATKFGHYASSGNHRLESRELFPGTELRPPVALFTKLDPDTAEKEAERM